jgi:hypothetical protein
VETSIPAMLIAAMLLVSTVVMGRSSYSTFGELGDSWKAMEARAGQQARTQLTVTNVTHNSPYVDVELRNDGSTRLAEFDRMDVVVEYTDSAPTFILAYIGYSDGALSQNTWSVQSISNDAFEPGILNPGETLNMRIWLDPAAGSGTTNRLLIATELGVTISTTFQG